MKKYTTLIILLTIFSINIPLNIVSANTFDFDTSQYSEEELQSIVDSLQKEVSKAEKKSGSKKNTFYKTKKQKIDADREALLKSSTSTTPTTESEIIARLEKRVAEIQQMIVDFIANMLKK